MLNTSKLIKRRRNLSYQQPRSIPLARLIQWRLSSVAEEGQPIRLKSVQIKHKETVWPLRISVHSDLCARSVKKSKLTWETGNHPISSKLIWRTTCFNLALPWGSYIPSLLRRRVGKKVRLRVDTQWGERETQRGTTLVDTELGAQSTYSIELGDRDSCIRKVEKPSCVSGRPLLCRRV